MAFGPNPYANPLASAKRAGILQIVLNSLGLLIGFCLGAFVLTAWDQVVTSQRASLPAGIDLELLRNIYLVVAIAMTGFCILMVILGIFVCKGSKGATITSIVFSLLAVVYFVINTVSVLSMGNPVGVLISLGLLACMIWLTAWLFQAVSGINKHRIAQFQYAQYYQQQQQQQPGAIPTQYPSQPYAQPPAPSQQPQTFQQPQWPNPNQQNWPPPQA